MRKFLKWLYTTVGGRSLVLIIIFIVAFASCNGNSSQPNQGTSNSNAKESLPTSDSKLTSSMKDIAVASIQAYPQVRDAAISQDGKTLSLVIVVASATSPQRAQELGDNFVRMVKSQSQDTPPGKEIGTGIYDYLVGVYYPNEKLVAQGAKSRVAKRISW